MPLGTAHVTITTADVFLPEEWAAIPEVARDENLVMAGLVNRRDSDAKGRGDRVHIPFVSQVSANAKSANTEVTFNAPTETAVTVTLNRHFESSVLIEDRADTQSAYDLAMLYGKRIGYAIAEQIDTDLTGLYSGLSQTVGTGHTSLTEANVVRAIEYLDTANAPQSDRSFVVHPSAMNALRQIGRFTEYQTTGQSTAPMVGGNGGLVGDVFGVRVYMSTNIQRVSGTPGIDHNLLFHKDAFCLIMQKSVSVEVERKATWLGTAHVASALWGYAELRDDHAVDVKTVRNT